MPSMIDLFVGYLDSLTGHLALAAYLLAVTVHPLGFQSFLPAGRFDPGHQLL